MMWVNWRCPHEPKKKRVGAWMVLPLSSLLIMGACVPPKVTVTSSPNFNPATIHKLAILPFETLSTPQRFQSSTSQPSVEPTEIRSQFRLPASQLERGRLTNADSVKVPKLAAERITKMVFEALEHRADVHLVSSMEVNNMLSKTGDRDAVVNRKEHVKNVGSQLKVDAVVIGLVRTYRERVGTKIGATPAAVGFEVHLVDPQSGRIHWTGEYYEEQKPMNEDFMGFVERGGAFVTARELAEYGVHKTMQKLPVGGDGPLSK